MQRISPICLVLLLLAACHSSGSDPAKVIPQPSEAQVNREEGPPMMEKKGSSVPVLLTAGEKSDFRKAVESTVVAKDSAVSHIHADVQDGRLVFTPEPSQDPSHVTEDAPHIRLGGPNPRTVVVVATPAARQLLDQKASQSQ